MDWRSSPRRTATLRRSSATRSSAAALASAGAASLAKPGDITPVPVKSRYGYHIIKLIAKGSDAPASEKLAYKKQLVDQQLQNPQGIGMWIQYLMSNAKVDYNLTPSAPAPAKATAKPVTKTKR